MKHKKLAQFFKSKPWHWYVAVVLMIMAGFLRFYRIPQTLMFLGDQGRDAIIVSKIFKELDPVLIGPVTSVGNMYLGPLYYYFMMPFLWLSYPSPLGPVYAVAFFSTLSIFLLYTVGKKMFSPVTGLLSAFFMAFSYSAIELSRFSWNPNLAPLLAILMIYHCWKALRQPKYWLWVAVWFSAIIQLHYLALLTGVSAGFLWIYSAFIAKKAKRTKQFLISSLFSLLIVLLSFTPLVLFDLRHGGINYQAIQSIFTKEEIFVDKQASSISNSISRYLANSVGRASTIFVNLNLGSQIKYERVFLAIISIALIYLLIKKKNETKHDALVVLLAFIIIGVLGATAYQHSLFTHYIAYLIPVVCICFALTLRVIIKVLKKWSIPILLTTIIGYIAINYPLWPLKPHNLFFNTQQISAQVASLLNEDDRYEIVLLSETNDHHGQSYRYFLSTTNNPPVVRDKGEIPNTLVIIDEEKKVEDVAQIPIYDIVVFPSKEIDQFVENKDLADIYILRVK